MDGQITNPVKVIRAKCLECCCGQVKEVENCAAIACPLHEWRFGKNPFRKKIEMSEERREELRERMRKMRLESGDDEE